MKVKINVRVILFILFRQQSEYFLLIEPGIEFQRYLFSCRIIVFSFRGIAFPGDVILLLL